MKQQHRRLQKRGTRFAIDHTFATVAERREFEALYKLLGSHKQPTVDLAVRMIIAAFPSAIDRNFIAAEIETPDRTPAQKCDKFCSSRVASRA